MIENVIPILNVKSLKASLEYYENALGFTKDWGNDGFAGLSRDGWRIYLAQEGQGQSGTWLWVGVEDVDAMYTECTSKGAKLTSEIISNAWAREFQVEDLDGHVLRFGGEPEAE